MSKYIYNPTEESIYYQGREVPSLGFFQIPENLISEYTSDSQLISDLASLIVKMSSDGISTLSGSGSDHVDFLKNLIPATIAINSLTAFASKILPDGKKLYKRYWGIQAAVDSGENTIIYTIPYPQVKIIGVDILYAETLDTISLFILDSTTGTYSTIPNYILNQFGFDVNISKDFFRQESNYDADLFQDMQIKIVYNSQSAKTIGINFNLSEVK